MKPRVLLLAAVFLAGCAKTAAPPAPDPAPPAVAAAAASANKETLNDQAFAQIKAQNWPEAIRLAQQAIALDANFAPARFNLGLALYRAKRYQEAAPHLEVAYRLNKAQVEPGWFLYLTLDALGSTRAATVLADLQARFPDDQAVRQAAGGGALVWTRTPEEKQTVLFLGDRELLAWPGGMLEMRGYPDKRLWTFELDKDLLELIVDPSGQRALALRNVAAVMLDLNSGAFLGNAPPEVTTALVDQMARVVWRGDYIYFGADEWGPDGGGGRKYLDTRWSIYRLLSDGKQVTWQQTGVPFVTGQQLFVSKDGHTALGQMAPGAPFVLYKDGREGRPFDRATGLTVMGDAVYTFDGANAITLTGQDGKPLAGWRAPAGIARLQAWDGLDSTWFVAAADQRYIVVTDHGTVAFQGDGEVVATAPAYLIVRQAGLLQAIDRTGKQRATCPGNVPNITADGRWVYTGSQAEVRACRLP